MHLEERGVMHVDWGEASRALQDSASNGDMCLVQVRKEGVLMAAMDALGHGPDAAATAAAARAALEGDPEASLPGLMRHCHERLRGTRGVALSMAFLDEAAATMTWLGVGNISGLLVRAGRAGSTRDATLLLRTGIVGRTLPQIGVETLSVASGDRLILATDGICANFGDDLPAGGPAQGQADRILDRYRRGDDDALVMVAIFRGARS